MLIVATGYRAFAYAYVYGYARNPYAYVTV